MLCPILTPARPQIFSPTDISAVDLLSRNNFERSIDSDHESPAAPAKRRFKRVLSDEEEDNSNY